MRVLVAATAALLTFMGCSSTDEADPSVNGSLSDEAVNEIYGPADVIYNVGGTSAGASVTMETPSGSTGITGPVNRYWRNDFDRGSFVYISAQNNGEYGTVTCSIKVDGVQVSSNTSSAPYGIASCEASAD